MKPKQHFNSIEAVIADLFGHFAAKPADLPAEWGEDISSVDDPVRLRRIGDYIAGMTDRYALAEHARWFASTPELH